MPDTATQPQRDQRSVPAEALRFGAECEFAYGDEKQTPNTHRIRGVARSGDAVEHGYWGTIVHDLAGMQPRGERVQLDWCHWHGDALGFVDRFDVSSGDLVVEAMLMSVREGDQASEVITRGKAGHPYELSIDFNGPELVIEEYAAGQTVTVNNRQFTGPLTVVRKWQVRSVALCPFGRDHRTHAKFSDSEHDGDSTVSVTVVSHPGKESKMSEQQTPDTTQAPAAPSQEEVSQFSSFVTKYFGWMSGQKPAEQPPQQPTGDNAPADNKLSDQPADTPSGATAGSPSSATARRGSPDPAITKLKLFTDTFGPEAGARYFAEGTDFQTALQKEFTAARTQLGEKDKEIGDLKAKFAAVRTGEETDLELSTSETPDGGEATKEFAHLGAAANYAASIAASRNN